MGKVRRVRVSGGGAAAVGLNVPTVGADEVMGAGAEKGKTPGRGGGMGGW